MRANVQRLPVLLFLLMFAGTAAWAQLPTDLTHGNQPSLAPLVKRVTPAVVNISVIAHSRQAANPLLQDPFFRRFFPNMPEEERSVPLQATGSGVIINADKGYILTNNHVIEHADKITVTLKDKRQFQAKLIGTDKGTDIALLQIKAKNLKALPLGDSDNLEVGDYVVAIGDPFALGQTVTAGIVSALGRTSLGIEGRQGYEDFIQTDASINPGNSGGALVDLNGHLVGINTAIVSPAGGNVGIGFAVPINMAKAIEGQLIKYGKVRRGQLGIGVQDVTPALSQAKDLKVDHGAVVTQVIPGSAAEKAGLKPYDVILEFNGKPVEGAGDLRNKVGVLPIGQKVTLTVSRDGHRMKMTATIGEASASSLSSSGGSVSVGRLEGAQFRNLTPSDPQYGQVQGVVVSQVDPGSRAASNGLRQGDVVTAVNRTPVHNVQEFDKAMSSVSGAIALTIVRGNGTLFLVIQ